MARRKIIFTEDRKDHEDKPFDEKGGRLEKPLDRHSGRMVLKDGISL
jgi:hypothetical protein